MIKIITLLFIALFTSSCATFLTCDESCAHKGMVCGGEFAGSEYKTEAEPRYICTKPQTYQDLENIDRYKGRSQDKVDNSNALKTTNAVFNLLAPSPTPNQK